MKIGALEIGKEPFIIAEAGINHGGIVNNACEMVYIANRAGCSAIKYQTYRTEEFCRPDDPMFDIFKQCELPRDSWSIIKEECDRMEIVFLSTPQNPSDLELLLPLGMPAIKVGSDDFCNLPLLRKYAKHGLPMILSCGMSIGTEIHTTAHALGWGNGIFMLCTSQYPTLAVEVNVSRLETLRGLTAPSPQGFSDHTHCSSDASSIMAVALGACVFERHFTLSHDLPGPEHAWACEPHDLRRWVRSIREAWEMRGTGSFELSEREREQKRLYQRRPGQMIRGEA